MSATHSSAAAPSTSLRSLTVHRQKWRRPDSGRYRRASLERNGKVDRVGRQMAAERGLTFTASKAGEYVSGRLTGVASLSSGRFTMMEDGIGLRLVPWQPILEEPLFWPICDRHSARQWQNRLGIWKTTWAGTVIWSEDLQALSWRSANAWLPSDFYARTHMFSTTSRQSMLKPAVESAILRVCPPPKCFGAKIFLALGIVLATMWAAGH